MRKVHRLHYASILCEIWNRNGDTLTTTGDERVTCKRCLKIMEGK